MLEPEEMLPALTNELYSYRLAVQDQLGRIAIATQNVREERGQIEADEYELLFGPAGPPQGLTRARPRLLVGDVRLM